MGVKRKIKVDNGENAIFMCDAFSEFLAEKASQNLVEKTLNNYAKSYEYFIEFEFDGNDEIDIATVQKIYVQHWVADMLKQGKRATTINRYLRDIRTFLYWCMDIDRQYLNTYKIELVKGQEELPKIFTTEEVLLLLQKPTNQKDFVEWRNWAIVNWVLGTGNRASTICNVKIGDIDFDTKRIILRHTKNKKAQVLPILSSTMEKAIKLYIKKCRSGKYVTSDSYLFPSVEEVQLTYNALAHSFSKYCKERNVEHTNIHGLRHYFATEWAKNNGGDGDRLQIILGHSDYTMTKRYIKLSTEDLTTGGLDCTPLDKINVKKRHKKVVEMK